MTLDIERPSTKGSGQRWTLGLLAAAALFLSPAMTVAQEAPSAAQPAPSGSVQPPAVQTSPVQDAAPVPEVAPDQTTGPDEPLAPSEDMPAEGPAAAEDDVPAVPVEATEAELPHDLSPWGMFMAADLVVKAVMVGLAFASLLTWTVWLAKSLELVGARRRARRALDLIVDAPTLADAAAAFARRKGAAALLVRAAEREVAMSGDSIDRGGAAGLKERVTSHLSRIEAQAGRRMTRGTGLLATIGSTAPFVGLFGTVWGIMNSFIGIAEAQTTNLAVVAPGIAEALLATGIGLVAAIPAVVIYNVFARSIAGYRLVLADAAAAVERLVSRDLDRRAASASLPLAAE